MRTACLIGRNWMPPVVAGVIEDGRTLIPQIIAYPSPFYIRGGDEPMRLDLVGNLAVLLAEPTGNAKAIELVAGGGLEPPTYGL